MSGWIDGLFWLTGCLVWAFVAIMSILWGMPDWDWSLRGITRLTFYGFGPVLLRALPENAETLRNLEKAGYHLLPIGRHLLIGWSWPRWLASRIHARRKANS